MFLGLSDPFLDVELQPLAEDSTINDQLPDIEVGLSQSMVDSPAAAATKQQGVQRFPPRPVDLGVKANLINRFNKITKNVVQIATAFDGNGRTG